MNTAATIAARIANTDWYLTAIHSGTGDCDHCGRTLKHLYTVRNGQTGEDMIVGRGCCKKVTGWTLTAAQAARALRGAEAKARADATWDRFAQAHPECAAKLRRDRDTELLRMRTATYTGGGPIAQHYNQIRNGSIPEGRWGEAAGRYMAGQIT